LPKCYAEGIDLQWHDIELGKPSYLRGRWQDRGWWYWYLYALAVKVPLGTWALVVLGIALRAVRQIAKSHGDPFATREVASWRDELVLMAPAIAVLLLVSSQTGFSKYLRYVLPMFPYVFIWISGIVRDSNAEGAPDRGSRIVTAITGALLAWSVGSSLWYAPHWMSYFNELAGGPKGGPAHLIDAQVDWGQDLLYLKRWLNGHPEAEPLRLAYFTPIAIDPRLAGVEFTLPPKGVPRGDDRSLIAQIPDDLAPGWYAISVNLLYGYPDTVPDGHGGVDASVLPYYSYFRRFEPVESAGYSIYIYHLTVRDIEASSAEFVGEFWLGEGSEGVIQRDLRGFKRTEAVGFSGGQFGFVV
jgi:hypothetical protein